MREDDWVSACYDRHVNLFIFWKLNMRTKSILYIGAGFLMFGCSSDKEDFTFAWESSNNGSSSGSDTGNVDNTDSGSDSDSDSESDSETGEESGEDDGTLGSEEFDDPGDVIVDEDDDDGVLDIDLTDADGEDNKNHEFYLVFVNTGDSDNSYSLQYSVPANDDTGSGSEEEEPPQRTSQLPKPPKQKSEYDRRLEEAKEAGRVKLVTPPVLPPPPTTEMDIGSARQMFKVRDSVDDDSSWEDVETVLWAVGTYVDIWVDTSVAIDWDYQCDGIPDVYDAPDQLGRDAYGFDNCDLETIANIVDVNIFPNLRTIFGDESDVNGDEKVNVVITPVLNQMTSGSEDDSSSLVGSYADPAVDLADFDPNENPISDEMEVIYIHAPDPYGFHNPAALTPIEKYTNVELGTQIAGALFSLISYNQHVVVAEGDEEEPWINLGLAALAADLTGFGAPYYKGVWEYLDAPHLTSLTEIEESDGTVAIGSYGAQYLFFRWLTDAYGSEILSSLVQTGDTGEQNIESVLEEEMGDLVLLWQLALLSTYSTSSDTGLDIDADEFPPLAEVSFVTAPTSNPSEGDYFGANGYQMGVDVGSGNQYIKGGTTSSPESVSGSEVNLSHTDHSTLVYGQDFYGFAIGGYGAQVVRLVDVPFTATELEIRAATEGYKVAVIRADDPGFQDFSKDTLYSPTQIDDILLPSLPLDGTPIYGLGDITPPGLTIVVSSDEDSSTEVPDTDRWLLSLSNYPNGSEVRVGVWLDHRYSDLNGDVELVDPWLAVVPKELLPVPTVDGTQSGVCTDGEEFGFPYRLLEHLYYQVLLSSEAYDETDEEDFVPEGESDSEEEEGGSDSSGFDPCGDQSSDPTTCDIDWDRDGVLDEDEPQPATLISQMRVMQCTLANNDWSGVSEPIGLDVIDVDQQDEDEDPTYDTRLNVGSVSVDSYEGAFIDIKLEGGKDYVIVVGASSGVGPYEFTVKKLPLQ